MNTCRTYGCKQEQHPNPKAKGRCPDCWQDMVEHTVYEIKWYAYWNAHGKDYRPQYDYPQFVNEAIAEIA